MVRLTVRLTAVALCVIPPLAGASPDQIRSAAARAVARLQSSQKTWFSEQSCSSCHHQLLPALAFRDARGHGVPVDEKIARADAEQAFAIYADLDRAVEHAHIVDPGIGDAYSLLAADAAGVRPSLVTAVYARFLAQRQKPDGHWNTFDQRPPQSSSIVTATALAIRAIGIYAHPSLKDDARLRIERARGWLLARAPRDTEERAFQLLGLKWSGADRSVLAARAKALEGLQQADGGWNSLDGGSSDAYSTGQVLVALSEAALNQTSIAPTSPAVRRGIEYLLTSQQPDGTWHVASRLYPPAPLSPDYFESGYPYGHDQMLSALGASWAIMALSRALPAVRNAAIAELRAAAPDGVEPNVDPWVDALLFGSTQDLSRLLDAGFDPNAVTKDAGKHGGTTALVLAAPDVDKLKLLLDRGARINARTPDGYSALMMAALYANSTPSIRLLLDRGAEIHPPSGSPEPLFRAYPAALAAIAGNASAVSLLRRAGDDVNAIYEYAGIEPAAPLILLSTFDDLAVVRALLDSGALVDKADAEGLTALEWATLANQTGMAELLIEHGADVNHVDKHGMTALLYAASIDFGDASVIDLLLRHGANRNARSPQGLTALDLAKKYHHSHLLKSLADQP